MANTGSVQIQLENFAELQNALANFPSIANPILQNAVTDAGSALAKFTTRGVVPFVTGNLLQSFRLQQISPLSVRWFPTAFYSNYVYFGTRPHDIYPKNKKALFWPGASHPVRMVHHPGSKPNPYIDRIAEAAEPSIQGYFQNAIEKITAQIANQSKL